MVRANYHGGLDTQENQQNAEMLLDQILNEIEVPR